MRETKIEAVVIKTARQHGGDAYKFVSPGRTGVPDRVVIRGVDSPAGRAGVLWVEVKAPNGRLSPRQRLELAALDRLGQRVAVVWTEEQARKEVGDFMTGRGLYALPDRAPCPFCGGSDVEVVEGSTFRWRRVLCSCGAMAPEARIVTTGPDSVDKREADAAARAFDEWNRRA